jgi:hypothetical protein
MRVAAQLQLCAIHLEEADVFCTVKTVTFALRTVVDPCHELELEPAVQHMIRRDYILRMIDEFFPSPSLA